MVLLYLKAKAQLENVTDLEPVDTPESPYEYTFTIECTKCREVHAKPVTINRFEQHEIDSSRGEASFVFRCKNCKSEHSANISRTPAKVAENDKWTKILELDCRGLEVKEFIPEGRWQCVGSETNTPFTEVDLEDGEWYDYDEKAGSEVSVTDVSYDIARS